MAGKSLERNIPLHQGNPYPKNILMAMAEMTAVE